MEKLKIGTKVILNKEFASEHYYDEISTLAKNKTVCTISEISNGGYLLEELKGCHFYEEEWSINEFEVVSEPRTETFISFNLNSWEKEMLTIILDQADLKFKKYDTPLNMFFDKEASCRIDMNYENRIDLDEIIEKCSEDLSDAFMDEDSLIDYDLMDDITKRIIDKYLKEKELKKEKEKKEYMESTLIFDTSVNLTTVIPVEMKKIKEDAIVPKYAHGFEDSGMDVFVNRIAVKEEGQWEEYTKYKLAPNETALVKTGVAVKIPQGTELQVRPTSGNSLKTMLRVSNSPGTVDSGFRNEIGVIITNIGTEYITINKEDKIAQLVLCPVYHANIKIVDEFSPDNSKRGLNEYGSTGTIKDVK